MSIMAPISAGELVDKITILRNKADRIGGYCHLSSGQEATTVGSVYALHDDDLLVTGYRCHGFALARGLSPAKGKVRSSLDDQKGRFGRHGLRYSRESSRR